ncbi:MAG: hypothetical protein RLZZ359_278 [Actinomycetota bacterium]|jgi:putative flippase GtrA
MNRKVLADSQLIKFAFVGGIGFLTDSGATLIFFSINSDSILSRGIGFLIAVSLTFYLNARFTFSAALRGVKAVKYFLVQLLGLGINFSVYAVMIGLIGANALNVVFSIASASVAAMSWNFLASKNFVFKEVNKRIKGH